MRQLTPSSGLFDAMAEAFGPISDLPDHAILAVSGGSDSMALLRMYRNWSERQGKRCTALTVDHGLRDESTIEAKQVAKWCREIGVPHHILSWSHDGDGNLSNAAREGRYRLMAAYCLEHNVDRLLTGHTKNDQAETVLMRLARGSGVDGLSAMAAETRLWGITVVRPLLSMSRETLQQYLGEFDQEWVDDPTNDNPTYDRVKAREALQHLTPLGLTVNKLAHTARLMGFARDALQAQAEELIARAVTYSPFGYASIDIAALREAPRETALRVLAGAVNKIAGKTYRPLLNLIEGALDWASTEPKTGGRTMHGCILRPKREQLLILREPNACTDIKTATKSPTLWDGRFYLALRGADPTDRELTISPLGEAGLAQITVKRDAFAEGWAESPREVRATTPGLWRGETLLSAPLVPYAADPDGPRLIARTVWPTSC